MFPLPHSLSLTSLNPLLSPQTLIIFNFSSSSSLFYPSYQLYFLPSFLNIFQIFKLFKVKYSLSIYLNSRKYSLTIHLINIYNFIPHLLKLLYCLLIQIYPFFFITLNIINIVLLKYFRFCSCSITLLFIQKPTYIFILYLLYHE